MPDPLHGGQTRISPRHCIHVVVTQCLLEVEEVEEVSEGEEEEVGREGGAEVGEVVTIKTLDHLNMSLVHKTIIKFTEYINFFERGRYISSSLSERSSM